MVRPVAVTTSAVCFTFVLAMVNQHGEDEREGARSPTAIRSARINGWVSLSVKSGTFGLPSKYKTKSLASVAVTEAPVLNSFSTERSASESPRRSPSVRRSKPSSPVALGACQMNLCRVPVRLNADRYSVSR